jgi:signal transduction histidine kinase
MKNAIRLKCAHLPRTDEGAAEQAIPPDRNQHLSQRQLGGSGQCVPAVKDKSDRHIEIITMQEDDTCTLVVADNGIGIPEENLEKIFEPFFSTKPGGTGLGLRMIQTVVSLYNGIIRVNSEAGGSTRFTIILPLLRKAALPANDRM